MRRNNSRQGFAFLLALLIVCPIVAGVGCWQRHHAKKAQARLAHHAQAAKATDEK